MSGAEIGALIGMFGGAGLGLFGWWFGRRQAKKNRGLDELYEHVWKTARSTSWIVTLIFIYFFFTLHLLGFTLSLASVLGLLLIIHMGGWAIIGAVLAIKYSLDK